MRKPGLAVAAIVSMIAATLLATHAHAVTLGGATQLRAVVAAVDLPEQVFCSGCPTVGYCGCGGPGYGSYYPPRGFYGDCCHPHWVYDDYYDPGPWLPPLALNWGVHTRWANGYTRY